MICKKADVKKEIAFKEVPLEPLKCSQHTITGSSAGTIATFGSIPPEGHLFIA